MKRALVKYRKSAFGRYIMRNQKYAPILFFMGGFIFDTLTLGRIDRIYDTVVLCSNKYLQFSVYFFISFTFFAFMIPTLIKEMNTFIFIISGLVSLGCTLALIRFIYRSSPGTRAEISLKKLISLILSIYITINVFYYFNLIPPVPLAMDTGMVAHDVRKTNGEYIVTYEKNQWYEFWRKHDINFHRQADQRVYVFTSVFAPTDLKKSIFHRWKRYNPETKSWEVTDKINFEVAGGRDRGFRGYTYKSNLREGQWKVDVITEEELVLGVVNFVIKNTSEPHKEGLVQKTF